MVGDQAAPFAAAAAALLIAAVLAAANLASRPRASLAVAGSLTRHLR